MPNPVYEFDPHGTNPQNIIRDERHTITVKNNYDFNYIIPDYAPFFTNDFKLYTKTQAGAKQYLVEGVDYVFGMRFIQAQTMAGKVVYASVSFINRNYSGDVYLEYRTMGGEWTISQEKIATILSDWVHNPVETSWEQVADLPYAFPPITHTHEVGKLTTVDDLIEEIRKLSGTSQTLIENIVQNKIALAIAEINKSTIGLGKVKNLAILPVNHGNDRSDNYYMTPRGTVDIIENYVMPTLNDHINATGNVHHMTPEDIDAVSLDDFKNALNKKLDKTGKAADTSKVDGRNSTQLKNWILEGTSDNTVKFNGLSYTQMIEDVTNRMNQLIDSATGVNNQLIINEVAGLTSGNTKKFGNKTPDQYADWLLENKDIDADTLNGKSAAKIITEARTGVDAVRLDGATRQEIINEARNNVNATTLGGKTINEIRQEFASTLNAATIDNKNLTQILKEAVAAANGNVDAATLNSKTADQIIREARSGVNLLGGKTVKQITDDIINSIEGQLDAQTLGGKTLTQIMGDAKAQTANNSSRLGGKTLAEIKTEMEDGLFSNLEGDFVNMGNGVGQLLPADINGVLKNVLKLGWSSIGQIKATVDTDDKGWFFRWVRELSNNENLNNFNDRSHCGIYTQNQNKNVLENQNYPLVGISGMLLVLPSAYEIMQIYITYRTHEIWIRNRNNITNKDTWTEWKRVSFDASYISHSYTGTRENYVASEKAVGSLLEYTNTKLNTKLGNSGDQTINNGTLTLGKPNIYTKIIMPTTNGLWRFETLPTANLETDPPTNPRINFVYVQGSVSRYIHFPAIATNENVAYQTWVNTQIKSSVDASFAKVFTNPNNFTSTIKVLGGTQFGIISTVDTDTGFKFPSAGALEAYVNNNLRMRLNTTVTEILSPNATHTLALDNNGALTVKQGTTTKFNSNTLKNEIINEIKAFFLDTSTNKIKSNLLPPSVWA